MASYKINKLDIEHLIFFDVDDTLVMHGKKTDPNAIDFVCPYSNEILKLVPHKRHIKILKDKKSRGTGVVVWSAGGKDWAERVVETLGLTNYVDMIMSKPIIFVDDLQADQILGTRLYLQDND